MGAQSFRYTIYAETAKDAYKTLRSEAVEEHGNDPYSGTIATCCECRCVKKFAGDYKKENDAYIRTLDYGEKRVASYVDLGVVEYRTEKLVKKTASVRPAIYKQYHVVWEVDAFHEKKKMLYRGDTKKQADDWVLAHCKTENVVVCKEPVCIEGDPVETRFELVVTKYKTKPKKIPAGRRLVEIHKFYFFGMAAC